MSVSVNSRKTNLFYDLLPKHLQDYVYAYDSTYHNLFISQHFKQELFHGYFQLKAVQQNAKIIIRNWLLQLAQNKEDWTNDWLLLLNGRWMLNERHYFEWQDHDEIFNVHFITKHDALYFKLLPLGIPYKHIYGHDGFFTRDHNGHLYINTQLQTF